MRYTAYFPLKSSALTSLSTSSRVWGPRPVEPEEESPTLISKSGGGYVNYSGVFPVLTFAAIVDGKFDVASKEEPPVPKFN